MRIFLGLIAQLACSLIVFSQTHYPLENGNRWEYGTISSPGQFSYQSFAAISTDTVLTNGKRYAIENNSDSGIRYLLQNGAQVFQLSSSGSDSVIYDFSYTYLWGETLSISYRGSDTLITTVTTGRELVFDISRMIWIFNTYSTNRSFYRNVKIADSVGCIQIDSKDSPSLYLVGAMIKRKQFGNLVTDIKNPSSHPTTYTLFQNYPNPFNPATTIRYDVPYESRVTINIFTVLGQEIRTLVNEVKGAGSYSVTFNAGTFPSGVYYYRLTVGSHICQKEMIIIR